MSDPAAPRSGIAWDRYAPWFLRGRVFRLAIQSRLLTLAVAGVLLTQFGWWGLAGVFSGTDERAVTQLLSSYRSCPWTDADAAPRAGPAKLAPTKFFSDASGPEIGLPPSDAYFDPAARLSAPFRQFFDASRSVTGAAFLLLCCIWAAAVWALFGGAISRAVVVQLAREEAVSTGQASRHVLGRWKSYFSAPLFPLAAACIVALPAVVIGLIMKASLLAAGIIWPIALLIGLIGAILLAGLSVGFPLMHAAISTEGSDSFDALSRSYSYVYQRPLHYLFYALSAFVLGVIGLFVVNVFAGVVEGLAFWSVSWGSGAERAMEAAASAHGATHAEYWGGRMFWFWHGLVRVIVLAFAFAFFWTASTAIYLLLRYDVDGAELDEVYLSDTGETFAAPPLATDAAGVPVVPAAVVVPGGNVHEPPTSA